MVIERDDILVKISVERRGEWNLGIGNKGNHSHPARRWKSWRMVLMKFYSEELFYYFVNQNMRIRTDMKGEWFASTVTIMEMIVEESPKISSESILVREL